MKPAFFLFMVVLGLLLMPVGARAQSITLDRGDGLINGRIISDTDVDFYLRLSNPTAEYFNINNGFRLYSPDGATWSNFGADTLNMPAGTFWYFYVNCFSCDGIGADSVQFGGFGDYITEGLPPSYNDVAYRIHFHSDPGTQGKTICLDSSFTFPGGYWKWASFSGATVFPSWDGPHCFLIDSIILVDAGLAATAQGDATLEYDDLNQILTVSNIGSGGEDGVILNVASNPDSSVIQRIAFDLGNVALDNDGDGISFEIIGHTGGTSLADPMQTVVGAVALANIGGSIQISADFNPIGDPEVAMEVYVNGLISGSAALTGGGLIAIGSDAGYGMPTILSVNITSLGDPGFIVKLDRHTKFDLTNGMTLYGDEIRMLAKNATATIDGYTNVGVGAIGIGFFTMSNMQTTGTGSLGCCFGFTGNIDDDVADLIDMGDLTRLIDYLFISMTPIICPEEANVDGTGGIDIGDLTRLIDFLFISFDPVEVCP